MYNIFETERKNFGLPYEEKIIALNFIILALAILSIPYIIISPIVLLLLIYINYCLIDYSNKYIKQLHENAKSAYSITPKLRKFDFLIFDPTTLYEDRPPSYNMTPLFILTLLINTISLFYYFLWFIFLILFIVHNQISLYLAAFVLSTILASIGIAYFISDRDEQNE